jgi:hypothetical protein
VPRHPPRIGKAFTGKDFCRLTLLVSHQEEFADAFPNGYHFELEDGATRVKRFQK